MQTSANGAAVIWYDSAKNVASYNYFANGIGKISSNNASYCRVNLPLANIDALSVNISDDNKDGQVKDFYEQTIDTSFTSSYKYIDPACYDYSENVIVNGEKKRKDVAVIGYVDLGTLPWTKQDTVTDKTRFRVSSYPDVHNFDPAQVGDIICARYTAVSADDTWQGNKVGIAVNGSGGQISVYDPSYSDADTFKTAMDGVMLYFLRATETVTYGDPIPNFPCEDGTTVTAITPQTELVNAIDVPSTIAYMTKAS